MRCSPNFALSVVVVFVSIASVTAKAQTPLKYSNVGRAPTQQEIQAWDKAVGPAGKELPPGHGSAKEGSQVYAKKCVFCHGPTLEGIGVGTANPVAPTLVGGKGPLDTSRPPIFVRLYPFATTLWDYINRAMPWGNGTTLTPDEVYAVTAFLLYKNDIIKENDVIDANSLPKVQMPNRYGFLPARLEDIHDPRKRGCRLGQCPESTNSK